MNIEKEIEKRLNILVDRYERLNIPIENIEKYLWWGLKNY